MNEALIAAALLLLSVTLYGLVYIYIRAEMQALREEVVRMHLDNKTMIKDQRQDIELLKYRIRRMKHPYKEDLT